MLRAVIWPFVRLACFTVLARGIFLWLEQSHQIYVDRWIAAMIGIAESVAIQAPSWVGWTLTGMAGLLAMAIWEIAKHRGWFPWGSTAVAITEEIDPFVTLKEAATTAYEETRGTVVATIAEASSRDGVLGYYARALFKGKTLYGNRPPSRKPEAIPGDEYRRCKISDNQSVLRRRTDNTVLYENLQIKRSDLSLRIAELRDLCATLSRENRANRISEIYAEAVELRNRCASLRVLSAADESTMDDLQNRLIVQMRDLAPEQAINLVTLNTYDPRHHPQMVLQDPKRTLEFSELLLRIKKILERYR